MAVFRTFPFLFLLGYFPPIYIVGVIILTPLMVLSNILESITGGSETKFSEVLLWPSVMRRNALQEKYTKKYNRYR